MPKSEALAGLPPYSAQVRGLSDARGESIGSESPASRGALGVEPGGRRGVAGAIDESCTAGGGRSMGSERASRVRGDSLMMTRDPDVSARASLAETPLT